MLDRPRIIGQLHACVANSCANLHAWIFVPPASYVFARHAHHAVSTQPLLTGVGALILSDNKSCQQGDKPQSSEALQALYVSDTEDSTVYLQVGMFLVYTVVLFAFVTASMFDDLEAQMAGLQRSAKRLMPRCSSVAATVAVRSLFFRSGA